jgi:hypothetical protein
MVDPYNLMGQEKTEQINYLFEIVENYENLINPTDRDKERYLQACMWIEAESRRREKQFAYSAATYGMKKHKLVNGQIERFKTILKLQFMEKHSDNMKVGRFTPEMNHDMDKMNRMEKAACYRVNGIHVSVQDCNTCSHHACKA